VTVIGVARHARDGVHATEELPLLVEQADAVVVLAPLTPETRGLVDAALLARMRDGALLLNAGRGGVVDTGALVAELEARRLRAVLDVVHPEPLPHDIRCGRRRWPSPRTTPATRQPRTSGRSDSGPSSSPASHAASRCATSSVRPPIGET